MLPLQCLSCVHRLCVTIFPFCICINAQWWTICKAIMFNCTLPVTAMWAINRLYLFTVTKKKCKRVCKAVLERWLKPLACCDTGKCEVLLRQAVYGWVYFEDIMLHSTKQVCLHSISAFFFFLTLHFSRVQRCKSEHLKRRLTYLIFYFIF